MASTLSVRLFELLCLALFVAGLVWLLPKLVRLAFLPFRRLARGRQKP